MHEYRVYTRLRASINLNPISGGARGDGILKINVVQLSETVRAVGRGDSS